MWWLVYSVASPIMGLIGWRIIGHLDRKNEPLRRHPMREWLAQSPTEGAFVALFAVAAGPMVLAGALTWAVCHATHRIVARRPSTNKLERLGAWFVGD